MFGKVYLSLERNAALTRHSPKAFDLITDPKEEYPQTALRNTRNAGPAIGIVTEFEKSVKKYPPIAPGTPDPYVPPK